MFGEYQVTGNRSYRGHTPGTIFEAQLDPGAAARAIRRGDICLLRWVDPEVPPGAELPDGWLATQETTTQGGRASGPQS